MTEDNKPDSSVMAINWAQQKAISSPFRSRLIGMLYEKPMTPKQAADALGKNPGTTYYHIQQLVKHGILEIDREETNKGIVEKYYRAKAISFHNPEYKKSEEEVEKLSANLYLSEALLKELNEEVHELLIRYGKQSFEEENRQNQQAYAVTFMVNKSEEE